MNSKAVSKGRREMRGVVRAEMFGQLTTGLEAAWSKLRGQGKLMLSSMFLLLRILLSLRGVVYVCV